MSRTQRLTEDFDTPTRRAISLMAAPSSRRRYRASCRSRVFTLENIQPRSDAKKRPAGLEPARRPWKGRVLPLHHGRAPIAYRRGSLFVGAALGRSRRTCGICRRLLLDAAAVAVGHDAPRGLRPRADPAARRVRDAAAHDRAALPARGPLPAELRHRRVGALPRRLRRRSRARSARGPLYPPAGRATALARHVL